MSEDDVVDLERARRIYYTMQIEKGYHEEQCVVYRHYGTCLTIREFSNTIEKWKGKGRQVRWEELGFQLRR